MLAHRSHLPIKQCLGILIYDQFQTCLQFQDHPLYFRWWLTNVNNLAHISQVKYWYCHRITKCMSAIDFISEKTGCHVSRHLPTRLTGFQVTKWIWSICVLIFSLCCESAYHFWRHFVSLCGWDKLKILPYLGLICSLYWCCKMFNISNYKFRALRALPSLGAFWALISLTDKKIYKCIWSEAIKNSKNVRNFFKCIF